MKALTLLLLITLLPCVSSAQDTLVKWDGTVLLVDVKEITSDYIAYTLQSQPNGPLRKVLQSSVDFIGYATGRREYFGKASDFPEDARVEDPAPPSSTGNVTEHAPGSINNTGYTVVIPRKGRDLKIRPGQRFPDPQGFNFSPLSNGRYMEGLMGYGNTSRVESDNSFGLPTDVVTVRNNVFLGMRFGSRFYLGSPSKQAYGLHVAWFTFTGMLNSDGKGDMLIAPANIGFSAAFLLDPQSSIEINTLTGFAASSIYRNNAGLSYGLSVKFTYMRLRAGLDYTRTSAIFGSPSEFANLYSFTLGASL